MPMETATSAPRLPPELERTIFEIAALGHPTTIPCLILVARRVKGWVEPLLFRIIMVVPSEFSLREMLGIPVFPVGILLRLIATKPPGLLQKSTQHLFLSPGVSPDTLTTICTACSGARNLSLFDFNTDMAAVDVFQHLERLALSRNALSLLCNTSVAHLVLGNITHLELSNPQNNPGFDELPACLSHMPRLTHIALDCDHIPDEPLVTVFRANTNLQCIAFLVSPEDLNDLMQRTELLVDDYRFICLGQEIDYRVDWLMGASRGKDYWELVDAFITARRKGKVERSRYTITDTDTSWRD
ncbi:hypothetical protein K438DRAFT_1979810 [Mycena galopus ATCC 62051]|nr:hypothetical protein K438DRAFT_1979810 [Mycena galopus ATCC 62051]